MNSTARIIASMTLAAASAAAISQTSIAPLPAASQPNTIGVNAEAAKVANDKAIKHSDVATVVRTGPTAADRARQVGERAVSATEPTINSTSTAVATASNRTATLAPRADRN